MSGGWVGSNRRSELPADWYTRVRPFVLARDEYRCRNRINGALCGRPANQVDHVGDKGDHRPEMLQALCEWCHGRKSSAQGNQSPNRAKSTEARPGEQHPGLI
ncbi:HNH endonuclease [Streptomyces sp. NPDC096324]|uniref:HNH endonuclease n=1 Tax=Streptomyces sp. NPDC096324 TaxID=3366085 RepID=UPI00381B14B6